MNSVSVFPLIMQTCMLYANVEYFNCPYFMTVCPHCYPLFYGTNRSELKVKLGMMRY